MSLAFGRPEGRKLEKDWFKKKAKRVLLLSATPFEDDYASIQRQLEVFGFGDAMLTGANGEPGISIATLADSEESEQEKRDVVQRLLLRRVSGLKINGRLHTKNMYRREWRRGGLEHHDKAIKIVDPKATPNSCANAEESSGSAPERTLQQPLSNRNVVFV